MNTTRSQSLSVIETFPPELLLIIFRLVHVDLREAVDAHDVKTITDLSSSCDKPVPDDASDEAKAKDVAALSAFPYSFSSVCTTWKNVMSMAPEFWTNIICFFDSNTYSSAELRSQLEWSHNLPIDVTITKQTDYFFDKGYMEKSRLREIIDILAPHTQRCKTLRYDVIYTSSLPLISTDICGPCPYLKSLALESRVADGIGGSDAPGSIVAGDREEFQFPVLETLVIDGYNFANLCNCVPTFGDQISRSNLKSISITNFND